MHHSVEFTVVLVVSLALLIGAATRWLSVLLRFPYTVAMLLVGAALGFGVHHLGLGQSVLGDAIHAAGELSPDLIIMIFLPALVFESAYAIDVHEFRKNLWAISLLAGPALVLSTFAVGAMMLWLVPADWGWGWPAALVFGALISATDPVAVVAILRELGVSKRLGILIEGESLFNDGTSIVVFTLLIGLLTGDVDSISAQGAVLDFARVVAGGVVVGLVFGWLFSKWIERLFNDPLAEITLTIVLAYSCMIVAQGLLDVSGVMAVVAAGLYMSAMGPTRISPEVSHFLHRFWEMLGYVANTLIFFLVGVVVAKEIEHSRASDVLVVLACYVGVMLIRFALTYLFQPLVSRLTDGVTTSDSHVISWGGLRGAVSLALSLVVAKNDSLPIQLRQQIVLVTAGVVLLTIVINGTTMGRLLSWLGYDKPALGVRVGRLAANLRVVQSVEHAVLSMKQSAELRTVPWDNALAQLKLREDNLEREVAQVRAALSKAPKAERMIGAWSRILDAEREVFRESFNTGTLGAVALQRLEHQLAQQQDAVQQGRFSAPKRREIPLEGSVLSKLNTERATFDRLTLSYELSRAEITASDRVQRVVRGLDGVDEAFTLEVATAYAGYAARAKERIEDMRANLPEMAAAIEQRLARRIELNSEREQIQTRRLSGELDDTAADAELDRVESEMHRLRFAKTRVAIPSIVELVASTPMFSGLNQEELSQLSAIIKERVFPRSDVLCRQGERGDKLFVVARGAVRVEVSVGGKTQVANVLGGGEILGEIAVLTGTDRTATAIAATALTVGEINRKDIMALLDELPALKAKIWRGLLQRQCDNTLREHPELALLSTTRTQRWLKQAEDFELQAEQSHQITDAQGWVYLLFGEILLREETLSGPVLAPLRGAKKLQALTSVRGLLLPEQRTSGD